MPEALREASPRIADLTGDNVAAVRARLTEVASDAERDAALYSPELARVWQEVGATLSSGKLVRPAILLAVASAASGARSNAGPAGDVGPATARPTPPTPSSAVVDLAAAVELLHHAFLLHDDVIDHDTVRRGRPNLIARLGDDLTPGGATPTDRRAVGEAAGILAGDLVLARAHDLLARVDVPHPVRLRLLDVLTQALAHSVAGELADVGYVYRVDRPALADVLAMSESKTGAYTVRLPILWALAVTNTPVPPQIEPYARAVGLAFQLQDDLLGLFGDPDVVGKDPVSDIREGKFTAVMAYASRTTAWPVIEGYLGRADVTAEDGARVLALLEHCGARAEVEADLQRVLEEARDLAAATGPLAPVLTTVVAALSERRS